MKAARILKQAFFLDKSGSTYKLGQNLYIFPRGYLSKNPDYKKEIELQFLKSVRSILDSKKDKEEVSDE